MQKDANLVELEKCCQTHIFLQKFVLIQPRTSPPKICKFFLIFPILLTLTPNLPTNSELPGREHAVEAGERAVEEASRAARDGRALVHGGPRPHGRVRGHVPPLRHALAQAPHLSKLSEVVTVGGVEGRNFVKISSKFHQI